LQEILHFALVILTTLQGGEMQDFLHSYI